MEVAKVTKLAHDIEVLKLERKLLVYRVVALLLALSLVASVTWCNFIIHTDNGPQEAVIIVSEEAVIPTAIVKAGYDETKGYTEYLSGGRRDKDTELA